MVRYSVQNRVCACLYDACVRAPLEHSGSPVADPDRTLQDAEYSRKQFGRRPSTSGSHCRTKSSTCDMMLDTVPLSGTMPRTAMARTCRHCRDRPASRLVHPSAATPASLNNVLRIEAHLTRGKRSCDGHPWKAHEHWVIVRVHEHQLEKVEPVVVTSNVMGQAATGGLEVAGQQAVDDDLQGAHMSNDWGAPLHCATQAF